MFTKKFLILNVLGVIIMVFFTSAAFSQEIRIASGAAFTENIYEKIKDPMEQKTGLRVKFDPCGPVDAWKYLDEGKADAAAGGLTFPDWVEMMEKAGYTIGDKKAYTYRVVGKDIVKVIVHKDVGAKKLSKEQLTAIFIGKILNWREMGYADVPVVVVYGSKIPGTQTVFQKQVMDGNPYTKKVLEATTADDVKLKVTSTRGGVGLGPVSIVDASISAPEIPEVGRPITLITRGAPSPAVSKMLDFIRGEGQKYIAK